MGIVSGTVVYLLIWWVVIFTVLPWGVVRSEDSGAPKDPKIKQKFIAASAISAVIWIVVYILIDAEIVSFREMAAKESL